MSASPVNPLSLRDGGIADIELIAQMHASSWASAYRGLLPELFLDQQVDAERLLHWQQRLPALARAGGALTIAEIAHDPVGFICLEPVDDSGSVLVDNLHARPALRGQGIGSTLLRHARAWALDRGASALHLEVLEGNHAARAFYQAQGFQFVASQPDRMAGIDIVAQRLRLALTRHRRWG